MKIKARFIFLFIFLLVLLMALPLFVERTLGGLLMHFFLSCILLSSLTTLKLGSKTMNFGLILMLPTLLINWTYFIFPSFFLELSFLFCSILFFIFLIGVLIKQATTSKKITPNLIFSALCTYLLIGISFGFLYRAIDLIHPQAFSLIDEKHLHSLLYFSFVTLTTLGYGDITPILPIAQSISYIEAILGQFFMTALLARLISLEVSQRP